MTRVDLAILGGGCAGLSLVHSLIDKGYQGTVVVVEPRTDYTHDRTWAFWQLARHKWSALVQTSWTRWALSAGNRKNVQSGHDYRYQIINAHAFYHHVSALIDTAPNVKLVKGERARSIVPRLDAVCVETDTSIYEANYVVDTRPRSPANDQSALWQVFYGGEIEVAQDTFNADTAGLMEDFQVSSGGVGFIYTLPTSARSALVQLTWFQQEHQNPQALEEDFWQVVARKYGQGARMMREEAGILPMGQVPLPSSPADPRILGAGQAHGALRASSGYGFWRIQYWADQMAAKLVAGRPPLVRTNDGPFLSLMDGIFLRALRGHFHQAPSWFLRLSRALTGDEFAEFMMGKVNFWLWVKVVWALPKAPFLTSLASRFLEPISHGGPRQ